LLDVDRSGGSVDVATDVVYMARSLLGLAPVPRSFRPQNPAIPPDEIIAANVASVGDGLDVDRNCTVDVATDIIYVARYKLGLSPVPSSFRALDPTIPADSSIASSVDSMCAAAECGADLPCSLGSCECCCGVWRCFPPGDPVICCLVLC
jgi:hypothetical protein